MRSFESIERFEENEKISLKKENGRMKNTNYLDIFDKVLYKDSMSTGRRS